MPHTATEPTPAQSTLLHQPLRAVVRLLSWMIVASAWATMNPLDVYAQNDAALGAPGEIRTDTTFGRIDDWFTLRTLDGDEMSFSEFRDRVLFVNFWATWCAPCVEEMPTIADLADSLKGEDVAFLLISIDEDKRPVRSFARAHGLSDLVYLRGWAPGASTFTGGFVPATFIVARDGSIVYRHHGAADWNIEPIRRFLRNKASG